jgi:uncharacterized protein with GYD domain
MPHFIALIRFTPKGLAAIKNSRDRMKLSKERVESSGGKSIGFYATLGAYDLVQIFEMPSQAAMMQYVMTARRDGFVDPLILPAFAEGEWSTILDAIPDCDSL